METLSKALSKAHRERAFIHCQIILVIAHIVHVENSHNDKADGYASGKSRPGPLRYLHIVRPPHHQKAHRNVHHHISQAATGELERFGTVEVSNSQSCSTKEENNGTHQVSEEQAEQGSKSKAGQPPTEDLSSRHLIAKDNGGGPERADMVQTVAMIKVFVEVVGAYL